LSIVRSDRKLPAGVLGILLGQFGIHKFLLGYRNEGMIMLIVTLVGYATTWFGGHRLVWAMTVIGLIEGIIYLVRSDSEFYNTYIAGRRGWF
jgi:TM2 domain-containing membrane protein YozV